MGDVYLLATECGRILFVGEHVYRWHEGQHRMICEGCGVTYATVPIQDVDDGPCIRCHFDAVKRIWYDVKQTLQNESPFVRPKRLRRLIKHAVRHALVVEALRTYFSVDPQDGGSEWDGGAFAHHSLERTLKRIGTLDLDERLQDVQIEGRYFPFALRLWTQGAGV